MLKEVRTTTTNERVKVLRKELGLTQTEFGKRIRLSQNHLTGIEKGHRNLTEAMSKLICTEFHVNEAWLRTGEGEMFVQTSNSAIDQLASEYNLDELDKEILSVYIQLPAQYRTALKAYLTGIMQKFKPPEQQKLSIDEEVEAYRRELEAEEKGTISHRSEESDSA